MNILLRSFCLISCAILSPLCIHAVEIGEISESRKYITETDFNNGARLSMNVLLAAGQKHLESGDWSPVHHLTEFGLITDIGLTRWPVRIGIDVFSSSDTATANISSFNSDITEIHIGPRFVMDIPDSMVTLYSGGGIAYANMEISGTTGSLTTVDSTTSLGAFLNAGFYLKFKKRWLIGFDLRYSEVRGNLGAGRNVNAGGWNTLLTAGVRF